MNIQKTSDFHPKNKHKGSYDFPKLLESFPALAQFVFENQYQNQTIDFSNPEAVKTLNAALLNSYYGFSTWSIPENFLCPPIPGRAEYIHHVAALLEETYGTLQTKKQIKVLDIGVGANCIYPILGVFEYNWKFVGSEIDKQAFEAAKTNCNSNQKLKENIELRLQTSKKNTFKNIIQPNEQFDITICNPPFHHSKEAANQGTLRKNENLGIQNNTKITLNFGGVNSELWCEGGEVAFISNLIYESVHFQKQCKWFSSLVSKKESIKPLLVHLKKVKATHKIIEMKHGNKVSRLLFWQF